MQEEKLTNKGLPPQSQGRNGGYDGYIRHKLVVIAVLAVVVAGIAVLSMGMGALNLSAKDVVLALFGQGDARAVAAVQNIRLPRVLTAIVAGIALSLAGCAYQSVLRNPLASASTLGISQGAAFGASIAIIVLAGGRGSSAAYEGVRGLDLVSDLCVDQAVRVVAHAFHHASVLHDDGSVVRADESQELKDGLAAFQVHHIRIATLLNASRYPLLGHQLD